MYSESISTLREIFLATQTTKDDKFKLTLLTTSKLSTQLWEVSETNEYHKGNSFRVS